MKGIFHSVRLPEVLINDLRARDAATVKVAAPLDRQQTRRVQLQPDYFGFIVDGAHLTDYGLSSDERTNPTYPAWQLQSRRN